MNIEKKKKLLNILNMKKVYVVYDEIMEFVDQVFDSESKAESFVSEKEEPDSYIICERVLL